MFLFYYPKSKFLVNVVQKSTSINCGRAYVYPLIYERVNPGNKEINHGYVTHSLVDPGNRREKPA